MERILVGIDGQHSAWEALARACALSRRIGAHLHVLLVQPPDGGPTAPGEARQEADLRRHLELRIEAAKAQGIPIQYYVAEGRYEEEIVRFVNHYRINLLVYELRDGEPSLQAIRHRIACKVEIVAPRKTILQPQERIA